MQSYRKRMAVQKQHNNKLKSKQVYFWSTNNTLFDDTRKFLISAISMYKRLVSTLEPFSDEEKLCKVKLHIFMKDLEILENGTCLEQKEVLGKYGRFIS